MADPLTFAQPLAFLLLPLPFLARRWLRPRPEAGEAPVLPPAIAALARPVGRGGPGRGDLPLALGLWLALILALAQPERLELRPDRSASERNIMLALDLSGSMETPDFALDGQTATRLAAVKRVAARFVQDRAGDRIGLVIFADRAYVAAPLTADLPAVARALEAAEIGLTGRSTAIAEGLGLALKRVLAEPGQTRIVVLLSDGRDTGARLDAREVGRLAAEKGVRVHTIALGPEDLETRPAARDAVDAVLLRDIAEASGGQSWRVRSMEDLAAMAADLDRLEPNPATRPPVIVPRPLWPWPAAAAFLLCLLAGWREAGGLPRGRRGTARTAAQDGPMAGRPSGPGSGGQAGPIPAGGGR